MRWDAIPGTFTTILLVVALPNLSSAQEAPLSMLLSCTGNDVGYVQTGTRTEGPMQAQAEHNRIAGLPPPPSQTAPTYGFVRTPGRMSIAIQGDTVRVRPSAGTAPSFGRSSDGWYALTDVSVRENEIRGKSTWGVMGKLKLVVDRRSGEVRFGDFSGVCEKAANDAESRKF